MCPNISIIIPVYKVPEKYLRQCVESCINQTLKDIEIILVDDGSPDDGGKICDEYSEKDNRIKVIHKENGGLVSARNAGYEVVKGQWHMYLDGDDWIDMDTCEELMKLLKKHPKIDIVFWKCIQELNDKSIKGKWEWPCKESEHLYIKDECKELSRNTLVYKSGIATAYCKLINTEYARKHGIFHNKTLRQGAEGLEFSLRAFYHAQKALYINVYWNHYRFYSNSISKKINEKNTEYITDCLKIIENDIITFDKNEAFRETLYQRTVYILLAIAMSTYFHPNNTESLFLRVRKYKNIIKGYKLYSDSIKKAPTDGMDRLRRCALLVIRLRMFFILDIIGRMKQVYFKKGKYNY